MRGQIYVDVRRGLPPATQPPHRAWSSRSLWTLITKMWNRVPLCRPSAFVSEYMLESIPVTVPPLVVHRVIHFVATILGPQGEEVSDEEWMEHCDLLRSLCLVSKLCRTHALQFLYGKLRLHLRLGKNPLSILIDTLTRSKSRELPFGYGAFTKTLILVAPSGTDLLSLEVSPLEVRNLLRMMPRLQTVVMSGEDEFPGYRLANKPVTTLEIQGHHAFPLLSKNFTCQALTFVQGLSILWGKSASTYNWALNEPSASQLPLPNLHSISISLDYLRDESIVDSSKMLNQINGWVMPHLTTFDFYTHPLTWSQGQHKLHEYIETFLQKHGYSIQYLALKGTRRGISPSLRELSRSCPNLRFLNICSTDNKWLVDRSRGAPCHPALETLIVDNPISDIENLRYLEKIEKFRGGVSKTFPRLCSAEIRWSYWNWNHPQSSLYAAQLSHASATFRVGVGPIHFVDENGTRQFERGDWKLSRKTTDEQGVYPSLLYVGVSPTV